jgi:hypothetical protein
MAKDEKKATVVRPCAVCGQSCQVWQRNQDGTYTHDNCLYNNQIVPFRK